jgi:histone-lysine N-methyltransferase ASH1L
MFTWFGRPATTPAKVPERTDMPPSSDADPSPHPALSAMLVPVETQTRIAPAASDAEAPTSCESSMPASTPATSVADATSFDSAPLSPRLAAEDANAVAKIAATATAIASSATSAFLAPLAKSNAAGGGPLEGEIKIEPLLDALKGQAAAAPEPAPETVESTIAAAVVVPVESEAQAGSVVPRADANMSTQALSDLAAPGAPGQMPPDSPTAAPLAADDSYNDYGHDSNEAARPRRSRASVGSYNLARLSGTAGHGKRLANGDNISARSIRRRSAAAAAKAAKTGGDGGASAPETPTAANVEAYNAAWGVASPAANGAGSATNNTPSAAGGSAFTPLSASKVAPVAAKNKPAPPFVHKKPAVPAKQTHATNAPSSQPQPDGYKSVPSQFDIAYALGKRPQQTPEEESAAVKMKRELRRLKDTDEYTHKDTRPVLQTVWSKGKLVTIGRRPGEPAERSETPSRDESRPRSVSAAPSTAPSVSTPSAAAAVGDDASTASSAVARPKRQRPAPAAKPREKPPKSKLRELEVVVPEPEVPKKPVKKYLDRGLYAGQPTPTDFRAGLGPLDRKELAKYPELMQPPRPNRVLPGPMMGALKLMAYGRDYKLPFDVCHPSASLPKPDEWRNMTRSECADIGGWMAGSALWMLCLVSVLSFSSYANTPPQTASLARPRTSGKRHPTRTRRRPSACASPRTSAARAARTAAWCTSATTPTATLAVSTAPTARLPT